MAMTAEKLKAAVDYGFTSWCASVHGRGAVSARECVWLGLRLAIEAFREDEEMSLDELDAIAEAAEKLP